MITGYTLTAVSLLGLGVIVGVIVLAFHFWDKDQ